MRAEYRPGRKSGVIVISGSDLPSGLLSIAIQRESDQKFFTASDKRHWLAEESFTEPELRQMPDGDHSFAIPSGLATSLNPRDSYTLWLRTGDGSTSKVLLTQAGDKRDSGKHGLGKDYGSTAPVETQAEEPVSARAPNRLIRRAIIILLVFACLAWFWIDPRGPDDYGFPPAPGPITLPQSEDYTPLEAVKRANALIRGTAKEQETAFDLYRFAAAHKEKSAYLPCGICLDPSLPPCGGAKKNAIEAADYYRQTPDQQAGASAMTHMRNWLEDEARTGNSQASAWLEEIGRD